MDIDFERSLAFDLKWEGEGYENVPGDPGGPTKAGITWRDFWAFLREHGQPVPSDPTEVRKMTKEQMREIYREHYWLPMHDPQLPWPVDIVTFDSAVNCGCGRAAKWVQAAVGAAPDGVIGPQTLASINVYLGTQGPVALANAVLARRTAFYHSVVVANPKMGKFLHGWLNRCADLAATIHSPEPPKV